MSYDSSYPGLSSHNHHQQHQNHHPNQYQYPKGSLEYEGELYATPPTHHVPLNSASAPPLPPKPPADYIRSSAMAEQQQLKYDGNNSLPPPPIPPHPIGRNDVTPPSLPYPVANELIDRRPLGQPRGPRQPVNQAFYANKSPKGPRRSPNSILPYPPDYPNGPPPQLSQPPQLPQPPQQGNRPPVHLPYPVDPSELSGPPMGAPVGQLPVGSGSQLPGSMGQGTGPGGPMGQGMCPIGVMGHEMNEYHQDSSNVIATSRNPYYQKPPQPLSEQIPVIPIAQKKNHRKPVSQEFKPPFDTGELHAPAQIDTTYVNAVVEPEPDTSSVPSSGQSSVHRTTSSNTAHSRLSNLQDDFKELKLNTQINEAYNTANQPPQSSSDTCSNNSWDDHEPPVPPVLQPAQQPIQGAYQVSQGAQPIQGAYQVSQGTHDGRRKSYTGSPPKIPAILRTPNKSSSSSNRYSMPPSATSPNFDPRDTRRQSYNPVSNDQSPAELADTVGEEIRPVTSYSSSIVSTDNVNFYNAYNRTSNVAKRSSAPTVDTTAIVEAPFRMKSMGAGSPFADSRSGESYLPRSKSSVEKGQGLAAPYEPQASMRSSSRSTTDDTLMRALNLPAIPSSTHSFDASRLSSRDFSKCEEAWSLQCLGEWISLYYPEDGDMLYSELVKALAGLFTHKVPTLNWVRAERLASHAVESMANYGFVKLDAVEGGEEKVILQLHVELNGVLTTLAGNGCYSSFSHSGDNLLNYRCYSPRCSRTLPMKDMPKMDLQVAPESNTDWAAYWNLSEDQLAEIDRRETKRQYAIHELITGEEGYVRDLTTLMRVFGDSLAACDPPIMKKQNEFWLNSFGTIRAIIDCNTEHLLTILKLRQKEQGPFVAGVADIVLGWIKQARPLYIAYADTYLLADRQLRTERDFNPSFAQWFERVSKDPRTRGVPHGFYFHRAIPRLARYGLLLKSIQKATLSSDPEWQLLERAIKECDEVTGLCNQRLAQVEKRIEILDLQSQIRFKSAEETADLRLTDKRRRVLRRGDVTRRGDYRMDWVPTHLILFDNFLVLSKIRKGMSSNQYYVTKKPIPMDLLVLEVCDSEPVTKSSSSKLGMGTFTSQVSAQDGSSKRMSILPSPISPIKPDGTSGSSQAVTSLGDGDKEVLYPFKISHLGQEGQTYTMYAMSSIDRERWKEAIITAKKQYSSAVYALNAEPFRMKVLADYAFGYEAANTPRIPVFSPATALDRALSDARRLYKSDSIPRPLAKSRINCGVSFVFADGHEYMFLGLDYGVYVSSPHTGSIWRRCIDISRVCQIDVIEELNVVILLADKALVYYNLDAVLSSSQNTTGRMNSNPTTVINNLNTGFRLSKHREVGFFNVGRMKDRTLLFYKRRDGMSSTFKVIEPVKEKGSQRKRSKMVFARSASLGSTEYFREVEKFYVPTDSYGISLFKSSFAVHTNKGFEVMSLDYKHPQTVPNPASVTSSVLTPIYRASNRRVPSPEAAKKRLENTKPIGMFRVSENALILCYEDFAMYADNHGNIIGPTVIEFVGKARDAALQHPYLLVFDDEMVEVRRIDTGGQLKQVISGKDIRVIDKKEGQIKVALAHPELAARQLVVELISNEFVVEDDNSSLAGL
ncbi:hypothetical protein TRVA0_024S00496 [Trichomonascus vanleenenianus]|uniref:Rho family guanine nucleotide exchange factor TUS1 n=1 Tax=Trichomonascus vanleenenianus TaxID=2268995 RepID=UPI003EC9BFA8